MIADEARSAGAALLLLSGGNGLDAVWSDSLDELCRNWVAGGWQTKTQRAPRMMALNHAGFVTESDVYGPGELELDEAYTNFLRPSGFGYGAGTGINMPTGETAVFSIERLHVDGPLTRGDCLRLDPLRPHLARAALLSIHSGLDRARTVTTLLETMKIPAAIIRGNKSVLASNNSFDSLIPHAFQESRGRLRLVNQSADHLLSLSLNSIRTSEAADVVNSIPIPSWLQHPAYIVHLLPLRRAALDFFTDASAILLVTPVTRSAVPRAEVLQGLFDLTPSEARVAKGIAEAKTVTSLAELWGVKPGTVRDQVKSVLSKTGAKRQSELVSLLSGTTFE